MLHVCARSSSLGSSLQGQRVTMLHIHRHSVSRMPDEASALLRAVFFTRCQLQQQPEQFTYARR